MGQRVVAAALLVFLTVGVAVLAAAGSGSGRYSPRIDPAAFGATIGNPYLPLRPGSTRARPTRASSARWSR
jgi:hypothetical protein